MRIIIETEPAAAQPRVLYESAEERTSAPAGDAGEIVQDEAIDGGEPAAELLNSLGMADAATGEPSPDVQSHVRRAGVDAGGAPSWLTAVIEGGASRRRPQ
jgi:hypothetical protein